MCKVFDCFARCFVTIVLCIVRLVFMSGIVLMFVVYLVLLNVVCVLSLGVCLCIVSVCIMCDGCCVFVSSDEFGCSWSGRICVEVCSSLWRMREVIIMDEAYSRVDYKTTL